MEELKSEGWSTADRSKYWTELNSTEQMARMHEVVQGLQGEVSALRERLVVLDSHEHGGQGQVMVRPNQAHEGLRFAGRGENPWF